MKPRIKTFLLGLCIIALIGGFVAVLSQRELAPPAEFASLRGERITLDSLRGKVVLVNFWATSCPGCIQEMPDLIETHRKYSARGLETIAVAMSYDPPNYVLAYTEKNALPFFVTLDVKGELARAFDDVKLTPTTVVIDKQGRIVQRTVGVLDFDKLHRLIEKELSAPA